MKQVLLYLGAFGAPTAKPMYLWTTSSWLCELQAYKIPKGTKFLDDDVCRKSVDKRGRIHVSGGAGLKGTQAYPDGLGAAIAKHWRQYRACIVFTPRPRLQYACMNGGRAARPKASLMSRKLHTQSVG